MTSYLLLRNNKESGPYSLDDLIKFGLKAYDLVWVQGKSAAWRYPSEVEELRAFAPAVEEQPFDRFYKKNGEAKKEQPIVTEEPHKQESPVVTQEHEKYIPKKSVFVTMPGSQKIATTQPIKKDLPALKEEPKPIPAHIQQTITISENPNATQVNYSQPLDDIKEMYVKTLYDRKQKIARKNFWLQNLKKVAVILFLIAIGVAAGFIFKSNGDKKELVAQKQEVVQPPTLKQDNPSIIQDTNSLANSEQDVQNLHMPSGGFVNKAHEQKNNPSELKQFLDKPISDNVKKELLTSSTETDLATGLVAHGVDTDPVTGERTRKVRSGTNTESKKTEERSVVSGELAGQVSVTCNEYKKVAFGGIRDLQLTVTNDSKLILDNVTVELQYLKPNEQPLRTENIHFTSVGPKATSTIRVPDTNRGIKVSFHIVNIKARQGDEVVSGN